MSLFDYRQSIDLSADDPTFAALVMALIRKADTFNRQLIDQCWPDISAEMEARYHAREGLLPGETAPEELRVPDPDPDGDL